MQWKARFSLRILLLLVAFTAVTTFVSLNGRRWHQNYLDWSARRLVRARAERIFRDETGKQPPPQLVHILGSGVLSHWAPVYDIGLTADQIISCGRDRAVRCWSLDNGDSLQVLSDVEGHVAAQSSLIAAIDQRKQVQVYDTSVSPLKLLRRFSIEDESAIREAFCSPIEPVLAVVYDERPNELRMFDLDNGTQLSRLALGHEADKVCFGFGGNGRLLAACKDEFLLFNLTNGKVVSTWKHNPWPFDRQLIHEAVPLAFPWWLIVGASTAIVWNEQTQDWKEVELGLGGTPEIVAPAFAGAACVAKSGVMLHVSLGKDELSKTILRTTPVMPVTCIAFRRYVGGGQIFTERAVAYARRHIGLLDEYGRLRLPREEVDHITTAAWSFDSDLLATGTSAGEIIVMRAGSWMEIQRFRAHSGSVDYIEFSPDGSTLLTEERHEIAVFNRNSAKALVRKSRQASSSRDATLSSGNGRLLAWVLNEGWTLTDYATNTLVARSERRAPRSQSFSPQGPVWSAADQCFVFVSARGFCRMKLIGERSSSGPTLDVTEAPNSDLRYLRDFSVDDSEALFFAKSKDGTRLRLWNWQSSAGKIMEAEPLADTPLARFTPSGRHIALIYKGDLIFYSRSGKELFRQPIGTAHITGSAIRFSPDERYIAIINGNGTCYLLRNPLDESDGY